MLTYDNVHRLGAQRQSVRQARRERGGHRLSAARLGRRPHLLLRAVLCRGLLRQLSGSRRDRGRGPPRDRHHLCLRAAAHLREPADADHGAHGGCRRAQAQDVPLSSSTSRANGARKSSTRRRCRSGARLIYSARRRSGLWPAEEPLRAVAHPRRLYGGRGDRPGNFPLLSRARHQPEAALRADRSLGLHHRAAGRRDLRRHGRQAEYRRRREDRRQRRGAVQVARRVPRLLQGPGEDRRDQDAGRLGAHRRCRLLRSQDRASEDHRSRQGCRPAEGRHAVRAEIHREQAEVLSEHQGSGGARRQARLRQP